LRANPNSYELLLELGSLYQQNYHDADRACKVWELAIRRWDQQESHKKEPDVRGLEQLAINLSRSEEELGKLDLAILHLQLAAKVSPNPAPLQQQIVQLNQKLTASKARSGTQP
jgi:hypothetical protein